VAGPGFGYIRRVNRLTRQEQLVLCSVLGLLLVGLAVKTYRAAHPPGSAAKPPAAALTSAVPGPDVN
jgi:hypothetical protein